METYKNIENIQDVNDFFDYLDEIGFEKGDNQKISCGRKNGFNELKYKYKKYYSRYKESDIAKAMCECCIKNKYHRSWDYFYLCLEKKGFKKANT